MKLLFVILSIVFLCFGTPIDNIHLSNQEKTKLDTIDFNICSHKTETINFRYHTEYVEQWFVLKNDFDYPIILDRVQTGAGYCMPIGFTNGYLEVGKTANIGIAFSLKARDSFTRPVGFYFRFCPNSKKEETHFVVKKFIGERRQ